jgi:hypothetical protein
VRRNKKREFRFYQSMSRSDDHELSEIRRQHARKNKLNAKKRALQAQLVVIDYAVEKAQKAIEAAERQYQENELLRQLEEKSFLCTWEPLARVPDGTTTVPVSFYVCEIRKEYIGTPHQLANSPEVQCAQTTTKLRYGGSLSEPVKAALSDFFEEEHALMWQVEKSLNAKKYKPLPDCVGVYTGVETLHVYYITAREQAEPNAKKRRQSMCAHHSDE